MESSGKNYYPLKVHRIPSEVGSPEPMVINPLLRSESHEGNDWRVLYLVNVHQLSQYIYIYIYTTDNNNKVIMILQHTLWDSINLTFMVKKQCINLICFLVWNCKNWDIPPYKIYKINVAAFDTMHQNITSQFCSKGLLYWYLIFITKKILEKNFRLIHSFVWLHIHCTCKLSSWSN